MTLVLSCITPNYVIQVSDRRLTWATGPQAGKTADDDSNKALVVCNSLVVAYTGLAQVGGLKTDEWLLDVAGSVIPYNPERVCQAIALRATSEFRNFILAKSLKRHAFLISGWARFHQRDAPLEPFSVAISNALNQTWQWLAEAKESFSYFGKRLDTDPFRLDSVGQHLPNRIHKQLVRRIRTYINRERGPEAYIQLLASAIRDTSSVNPLVGRNLMAIALPLPALSSNQGLTIPLKFPVSSKQPVALYLPSSSTEPVLYGPNYTCNGLDITGIWVKPGGQPEFDLVVGR
jgi:hypothetical protein